MLRGPEEIDPAQEANEQWRIAERRQRAADIGDQENEEDDDMGIAGAFGIGADQRPDQDHRRAGGADDAGDYRAEGENGEIGARRTAQGAGDKNAAGDDIECEQQDDEAHIFGERGVHESGERGRCAECDGQRQQRGQSPRKAILP